jgi:hypothetical protein
MFWQDRDPEPVGSVISWRLGSGSRKPGLQIRGPGSESNIYGSTPPVLWIRIRSNPKLQAAFECGKNHSGTGQLPIRNEFEVKLH